LKSRTRLCDLAQLIGLDRRRLGEEDQEGGRRGREEEEKRRRKEKKRRRRSRRKRQEEEESGGGVRRRDLHTRCQSWTVICFESAKLLAHFEDLRNGRRTNCCAAIDNEILQTRRPNQYGKKQSSTKWA